METPQLIGGFKQRFEQFVELYKSLKVESSHLLQLNEELKTTIDEKNIEIERLKNASKNNELANAFLNNGGDSQQAKQSINKIVREIDSCIALLNR